MLKTSLLLFSIVLFTGCSLMGFKRVNGNGEATTETRRVGSFTEIALSGSLNVEVQQGPDYTVTVIADKNLLPYIETEIDGNQLEVSTRSRYQLRPRTTMKVLVTAPELSTLTVTGSGNLNSLATLRSARRVAVNVTGSGDVNAAVDAPEVDLDITGSGTARLRGQTRNLNAEIMGSGDAQCFDLAAENVKLSVTGSGTSQVYASKNLKVDVTGSGDVRYKGSPSLNKKTTGSGSVAQVQ